MTIDRSQRPTGANLSSAAAVVLALALTTAGVAFAAKPYLDRGCDARGDPLTFSATHRK